MPSSRSVDRPGCRMTTGESEAAPRPAASCTAREATWPSQARRSVTRSTASPRDRVRGYRHATGSSQQDKAPVPRDRPVTGSCQQDKALVRWPAASSGRSPVSPDSNETPESAGPSVHFAVAEPEMQGRRAWYRPLVLRRRTPAGGSRTPAGAPAGWGSGARAGWRIGYTRFGAWTGERTGDTARLVDQAGLPGPELNATIAP